MKNDKFEKENRLLNTAFKLFTEKGIKETSIQDIVDSADVAKGTFYLYFKDKYQIRDILIAKKSEKLFSDALNSLRKTYIVSFASRTSSISFLEPKRSFHPVTSIKIILVFKDSVTFSRTFGSAVNRSCADFLFP